MINDAVEEQDRYDRIVMPRFLDFVEINFPHPDHAYGRFSADIVDICENYRWDFSVETNAESDYTIISWPVSAVSELGSQLVLFDKSTLELIDKSEIDSY